MPTPEVAYLRQKAVLWPARFYDDYGQPKIDSSVEIKVRWITKRSETLDPQGNTVQLDATVVVDRDIAIGSTMWLGKLADWYGTGSGGDASEVMQVVTFAKTPDLKGRAIRREVGLMRFRDSLPDRN